MKDVRNEHWFGLRCDWFEEKNEKKLSLVISFVVVGRLGGGMEGMEEQAE